MPSPNLLITPSSYEQLLEIDESVSIHDKNIRVLATEIFVWVSVGKKYSFFGKLGVLCFLITSVLRFAYLPYYRRKLNEIFIRDISHHNLEY